jgi:hypothetical protein
MLSSINHILYSFNPFFRMAGDVFGLLNFGHVKPEMARTKRVKKSTTNPHKKSSSFILLRVILHKEKLF